MFGNQSLKLLDFATHRLRLLFYIETASKNVCPKSEDPYIILPRPGPITSKLLKIITF